MSRPRSWAHDRDYFYKYLSPGGAKAVLTNCSVRYSSPSEFNDPFDLGFDLHLEYDEARILNDVLSHQWRTYTKAHAFKAGNKLGLALLYIREKAPGMNREDFDSLIGPGILESLQVGNRLVPELQSSLRSILSDAKVLCLSDAADNLLMWSHYCLNHTGVVLQLRCLTSLDSMWGGAEVVRYSREMPRLLSHEMLVEYLGGAVDLQEEVTMRSLLLTKALDWSYENEWRVVLHGADKSKKFEDVRINKYEISSLYLGCKIDAAFKDEIIQIARHNYNHAKIFQARKSDREFKIEFEEVVPST